MQYLMNFLIVGVEDSCDTVTALARIVVPVFLGRLAQSFAFTVPFINSPEASIKQDVYEYFLPQLSTRY